MKKETLYIPKLTIEHKEIESLSKQMDGFSKHHIDCQPWEGKLNGSAQFSIAYSANALLLKYYVIEEHIRAIFTKPKDPVYKDSCVEFFISFNNESEYYNLEFNCAGTCLAGFGDGKTERKLLENSKVDQIKTLAKFKNVIFDDRPMINWELMLVIPKTVFAFHEVDFEKGKQVDVNFYKCGDDLPNPHFLCWNEVQSEEPNFHLPEFFGNAIFE